jgi:hypothetical protein
MKVGGNRVYKLVEIKQLALYWNSDLIQGSPLGTSLDVEGSRPMHSLLVTEEEAVYLLRPTNVTLRLTVRSKFRNKHEFVLTSEPFRFLVIQYSPQSSCIK